MAGSAPVDVLRTRRGQRSHLRRLSLLLVAVLLLGLLAACGGDDDDDAADTAGSPTTISGAEATTASDVAAETTATAEPTGSASSPTAAVASASSPTAAVASATTTDATESTSTTAASPESTSAGSATSDEPVELTIGVAMTPPELETFQAGIDALIEAHPNWDITIEQTPQEGIIEKMNAQIAGEDLPDIVQVQGLMAQQWIRENVFIDLTDFAADETFNVDDFWGGALEQFSWNDGLYAIPNTVAPELIYINTDMFDAAGVPYPTDDWTFDEMREIARQLTLDANGNAPDDPDFDPNGVVQWGLNLTPANIWSRHLLLPFGADPCVNTDCTEVQFDDPAVIEALEWWTVLSQEDGSAPYDPYSGNQTGVPGDPFSAGLAAMGFNGFFLVGQLNATGEMNYDVLQPPVGPNGERAASLSTNGWAIPTTTENADAAWAVLSELTSDAFLREYWAKPGHAVPARASSSDAVLNPDAAPENQQAILDTLEYAQVFRPYTASAFEVYGRTVELFARIMSGDLTVAEGVREVDQAANEILAGDREE